MNRTTEIHIAGDPQHRGRGRITIEEDYRSGQPQIDVIVRDSAYDGIDRSVVVLTISPLEALRLAQVLRSAAEITDGDDQLPVI